jgi:hypothetical protein
VLLKFMTWNGVNFLVFVPLLIVTGLFGPIAIAHLAIERVGIFNRFTR